VYRLRGTHRAGSTNVVSCINAAGCPAAAAACCSSLLGVDFGSSALNDVLLYI
jgi:hypothetical protein